LHRAKGGHQGTGGCPADGLFFNAQRAIRISRWENALISRF